MIRRLRTLAFAIPVLAAALLGAGVTPAVAADPSTSSFLLQQAGQVAYRNIISKLDADLYTPSFSSIFNSAAQDQDLNRVMSSCADSPALRKATATILYAYCFQSDDATTHAWVPQGVTGVSDGANDELWGGEPQKPIIVTWYSNEGKGVRVSIIDPVSHRYRHALLVEPWINTSGNASYRPVTIHAGGIAWYGRYLYVPDTRYGIRVFDLEHIFDLHPLSGPRSQNLTTDTDDQSQVGRHNNVYYGYGYRFLIPQTSAWLQPSTAPTGDACSTADDSQGMRFSYLSVDRVNADTLVAGEYCKNTIGRMTTWPLGTIHQATINGTTTSVRPVTAWRLPVSNVQGAAHAGNSWYFSSSTGCDAAVLGTYTRTNTWVSSATRKIGIGSEDLYVWRGKSWIYSVTENAEYHWTNCSPQPGRVLFATFL